MPISVAVCENFGMASDGVVSRGEDGDNSCRRLEAQ